MQPPTEPQVNLIGVKTCQLHLVLSSSRPLVRTIEVGYNFFWQLGLDHRAGLRRPQTHFDFGFNFASAAIVAVETLLSI
ncbi:hypothetical protein CCHR01_08650 [Colletotrichum chrysophilum]|uniref:Uncharacterized protein n=1 Tax=Colletotrichum chrysophilum TaxID=1836956 RepID=A0AAD9EHK2_9PEZI|nr:hypothetical protein CCHR01_08650 [Colletotrichum chrysophilum]